MKTKNFKGSYRVDEFEEISEEFFNLLEPHSLFSILKQYWNEKDPEALCTHLAEAMDFYENFCSWLLLNKNLSKEATKKAKQLLRKIQKQRSLLLSLSNCK
jgi:hypothetical protein